MIRYRIYQDGYYVYKEINEGGAELSTGIRDTTGKEIYENDLVQREYRDGYIGKPFQVKYHIDGYDLVENRMLFDDLANLSPYTVPLRVVGNIHEDSKS